MAKDNDKNKKFTESKEFKAFQEACGSKEFLGNKTPDKDGIFRSKVEVLTEAVKKVMPPVDEAEVLAATPQAGAPVELVFTVMKIDGNEPLHIAGKINLELQETYGKLLPMDYDPKRVKRLTRIGDSDFVITDYTMAGRRLAFKAIRVPKEFTVDHVIGNFK